jgi:hypothetical protein
MVGVMAQVNTSDLPEASVHSQRITRGKKLNFPKKIGELCCEIVQSEWSFEHFGHANFHELFPTFDPVLVDSIVADSSTLEDALKVLLSLSDDEVCLSPEQQHPWSVVEPIADTTDVVAFPPLSAADGWEMVNEVDTTVNLSRLWSEVAKDSSNFTQQRFQSRPSAAFVPDRQISKCWVSEVEGEIEFENEHECKQRRGMERRLSQMKNSRHSDALHTAKRKGKQDRKTDIEPLRLSRFERVLLAQLGANSDRGNRAEPQ